MAENKRPGYYLDASGEWRKERRKASDRRRVGGKPPFMQERRGLLRRKSDHQAFLEDARAIETALEAFAAEHGGSL